MKYFESPILNKIRESDTKEALSYAKDAAFDYIDDIDKRAIFPENEALLNLAKFDTPLSLSPSTAKEVLEMLHKYGSPTSVVTTGGRYFGFVTGGILPSALTIKWLTDVWDQNSALFAMSPIASTLETIAEKWMIDLLSLPNSCVAGFVSGSSTATLVGLTAGRNKIYRNLGYDAAKDGLVNAPKIKVMLGADAHATVYKALSIIGIGKENVIKIPVDSEGRIIPEKMPPISKDTLIILQAGSVNSGAFDCFDIICKKANEAGAYVHVDGAIGMWAAACKELSYLVKGIELADSWSIDGHKTLNTPYDNGVVICKDKELLMSAMSATGSYLIKSENKDGMFYTPEMSRRARGIEMWATLKGLGKDGVDELVLELHHKARYFANLLKEGGFDVLNDVVFNQVMVYYKSNETTLALLEKIQKGGVCWMSGTTWGEKNVIRISVSSYKTTYKDIDISAKHILELAKML